MGIIKIPKFVGVEVYIPASQSTQSLFNFSDIAQLRGARVFGIEAYSADDISLSPTGIPLITTDVLKRAFITLNISDIDAPAGKVSYGEHIFQMPLISMHRTQSSGAGPLFTGTNPFVRDMLGFEGGTRMNWQKCKLGTGNTPIGIGNVSFYFGVYYRD